MRGQTSIAYFSTIDGDVTTFQVPSNLTGGVIANATLATAIATSIFIAGKEGMGAHGSFRTCVLHSIFWDKATHASGVLDIYDIRGAGTALLKIPMVSGVTLGSPLDIRLAVNGGIGFVMSTVVGAATTDITISWYFD